MMKNISRKSKRNPWRNTRNDYNIPWNDILGSIFMVLLPIIILIFSTNFVLRTNTFYSFYLTKSEITREIPYEISNDKLSKHFGEFMKHKKEDFQIKEDSRYKPQDIFSKRAINVMDSFRSFMDKTLIFGIILLGITIAIVFYLIKEKEKRLIYESFESSLIWYIVVVGAFLIANVVPAVSKMIFRVFYGVRFEVGDVLIQLLDNNLMIYFSVASTIVSAIIMGATFYLMYSLFSYHKMFK